MILELLIVLGLMFVAMVSLYQLTPFLSMPVLVTLFLGILNVVDLFLRTHTMSVRIVFTVLILGVLVTLPFTGDSGSMKLVCVGLNLSGLYMIWRKRDENEKTDRGA